MILLTSVTPINLFLKILSIKEELRLESLYLKLWAVCQKIHLFSIFFKRPQTLWQPSHQELVSLSPFPVSSQAYHCFNKQYGRSDALSLLRPGIRGHTAYIYFSWDACSGGSRPPCKKSDSPEAPIPEWSQRWPATASIKCHHAWLSLLDTQPSWVFRRQHPQPTSDNKHMRHLKWELWSQECHEFPTHNLVSEIKMVASLHCYVLR